MNWKELTKPDIWKAVLVIAALLVITFLLSGCASGRWQDPEVFAGAGYNVRDWSAPECRESKWIGKFGMAVPYVYGDGNSWEPTYTHNSCLDEERDESSSDSIELLHYWRF